MAFDAAMKMMGGKKPPMKGSKPKPEPKEGKAEGGHPDETGTQTHTIEQHPDGHFESHMHDGTHESHPDHLHLLAHLGHHISGGDKHHVAHHDGMAVHTHGMHEDGNHEETQSHNSAEEAKEAMGNFFNEEAQEPAHQHEPEGAMSGY